MRAINPASANAQRRLDQIQRLLKNQNMTARQLAADMHTCRQNIYPYIQHLRSGPRNQWKIYICGYLDQRGQRTPIYALGNRLDAPLPPPITAKEKQRRLRARINADPDARRRHLAKRNAHENPKRDPLHEWLFKRAA